MTTFGELDCGTLKKRDVDTSNREARLAVSDVAARCGPMRARIAVISARAERRLTAAVRLTLQEQCDAFQKDVEAARTELMLVLMDAAPRIARHSRVFDIEKALDNLEASLLQVRQRLNPSHGTKVQVGLLPDRGRSSP